MDVKSLLFKKILFPKVARIDAPGVIVSTSTRRFSSRSKKRRIMFEFEDILVDLEKAIINEVGKKAFQIYYELGKEIGALYFASAQAKKPPKVLLPQVISYLFETMRSSGVTLADHIHFDQDNQELTLKGKENIFSRKTKSVAFFAGFTSYVMTFLTGENQEATGTFKNGFSIVQTKKEPSRYDPPLISIPSEIIPSHPKGGASFQDLIRHKRIIVNSHGKYVFDGITITPAQVIFAGAIIKKLQKKNLDSIARIAIISSAKNIFNRMMPKNLTSQKKLTTFLNIFSALGWGVPILKKSKEKIEIYLKHFPSSIFGYEYQEMQFTALISLIYPRAIFKKCEYSKVSKALIITYNLPKA